MHTEYLSSLEVSGREKSFYVKYKDSIRCSCKEFLKHKGRPVNSEEAQNRNLEKT